MSEYPNVKPVDMLFPGRRNSIAEQMCQMRNVDKCRGDGTANSFRSK